MLKSLEFYSPQNLFPIIHKSFIFVTKKVKNTNILKDKGDNKKNVL